MKKMLGGTALVMACMILWVQLAASGAAFSETGAVTMKTSLSAVLPASRQVTGCTAVMGLPYTLPETEAQKLVRDLRVLQVSGGPQSVGRDEGKSRVIDLVMEVENGKSKRLQVYTAESGDIWAALTEGGRGKQYEMTESELRQMARVLTAALSGRAPDSLLSGRENFGANPTLKLFSADGLLYMDSWNAASHEPFLKPRPGGALGKEAAIAGAAELRGSEWKARYTLYENGMTLALTSQRLLDDETYITASLAFSGDGYQAFLKDAQSRIQSAQEMGPGWFGVINDNKAESVEAFSEDGRRVSYTRGLDAAGFLSEVRVDPDSARYVDGKGQTMPGARRLSVQFKNGVLYDIFYTDDTLLIASSDLDYAARYTLENACVLDDFYISEMSRLNPDTAKPVIYLYPERETEVSVKLDFKGEVTYTYPAYGSGWTVTASPDGRLTDANGEYYYLFWEGVAAEAWECEKGRVVAGGETEAYLRETLANMGLTPREYNDFITYWVPRMKDNAYNLISFSETQYDQIARLTVTPEPDGVLRVHMVWKALEEPVAAEPQPPPEGFERRGFTVVEWGGTEVF